MAAMLNEPFTLVMAPEGFVRDVQGYDKIIDKMTGILQAPASKP